MSILTSFLLAYLFALLAVTLKYPRTTCDLYVHASRWTLIPWFGVSEFGTASGRWLCFSLQATWEQRDLVECLERLPLAGEELIP